MGVQPACRVHVGGSDVEQTLRERSYVGDERSAIQVIAVHTSPKSQPGALTARLLNGEGSE